MQIGIVPKKIGLSVDAIRFCKRNCVANWFRNRTFHCGITGPLFLIAALAFLLSDVTETHINSLLVWPFVLIGVGIEFLLEWRHTRVVRRSF